LEKNIKKNQFFLLDIAAIAVPAGYIFGRIGNFLNQELIGRETTLSIGIHKWYSKTSFSTL